MSDYKEFMNKEIEKEIRRFENHWRGTSLTEEQGARLKAMVDALIVEKESPVFNTNNIVMISQESLERAVKEAVAKALSKQSYVIKFNHQVYDAEDTKRILEKVFSPTEGEQLRGVGWTPKRVSLWDKEVE